MTTSNLFRPKRKCKSYMPSAKSLANLVPYKKGENGHGRVYPLKERLCHALDKPLKQPAKDAPAGDQFVYSTLKGAIDLVPVAFRETWDRVDGKVPDKTLPGYQDHRQITIIVSDQEAKELTENIARRLLPRLEDDTRSD